MQCEQENEESLTVDLADMADYSVIRNLSAWRVSIPCAEVRGLPGSKQEYVYIMEVQRIDVCNDGRFHLNNELWNCFVIF